MAEGMRPKGMMAKMALADADDGGGEGQEPKREDRFDMVSEELADALHGNDKRKTARILRNVLAMLEGI